MRYEPNKKSVSKHEVPDWFHDAKLGIFIHWGIYSVPAFAETGQGDFHKLISEKGIDANFTQNPYAEWYLNSLRIEGSQTEKYHEKTYGKHFSYDEFIPMFNAAVSKWKPDEMAEIFKKAGAKYVVLVTKHHDGFLLWPSKYPNPRKKVKYHADRDIVGELTVAVRERGMEMGHYYSGTLDWSFNENHISDLKSFLKNGVIDPDYVEYANNHWHELIDFYDTKILWNDIGYPPGTNVNELFAYFYNKDPNGLINDRWMQLSPRLRKIATWKPIYWLLKKIINRALKKGNRGITPAPNHCDFVTPEYTNYDQIQEKKWESTRGIGNSFSYNQFEPEDQYLTSERLIHMFIDIVSKNGNLLLNVGPKADGTIPELQKSRLLDLGEWLQTNGEAIFGTRPWTDAEGELLDESMEVRFTQKQNILFVFLLGTPKNDSIIIQNLQIPPNVNITLLGHDELLEWELIGYDLRVELPKNLKFQHAHVLKLTPISQY